MDFDFEALAKHVNYDKKLLSDLINAFSSSYPIVCEKIKTNIHEENYDALEFNAHSLKGMICNFFPLELQNHAMALESLGQKKTVVDAIDHYNVLEEQIPLLIKNISTKFEIE